MYPFDESSSDLRAFGIQSDGYRSVVDAACFKALTSLTNVLYGLTMILSHTHTHTP